MSHVDAPDVDDEAVDEVEPSTEIDVDSTRGGLADHDAVRASSVDLPRSGVERLRAWLHDWVRPFRAAASDRALVVAAAVLVLAWVALVVALLGGGGLV